MDLPSTLAEALGADDAARAAFDAFAHTCRREIAEWIGEARRDATRQRRLEATMEALAEGRSPR